MAEAISGLMTAGTAQAGTQAAAQAGTQAALTTTQQAMLGMMAAGTTMQAGSQIASGMYNAQQAKTNAGLANQQARDAIQRGHEAESHHRQRVRRLVGSQRASFAGQGVDVGTGSAMDLQTDATLLGEHDAAAIRTNSDREAWGYRVQATNFTNQARMARMQGITGGFGTLLGGAAQTYSAYRLMR